MNPLENQTTTVIDPVCGMKVVPEKAKGKVEYKRQSYYFCCPGCAQKFQASPEKYLNAPKTSGLIQLGVMAPASSRAAGCATHASSPTHVEPAAIVSAGQGKVEYICPMDPEVVRDKPGACPICGMALEPRTLTLDS